MSDLTLLVATCNDDWASAGTNLRDVLEQHADVVGIQEGKRARYRSLVPIALYGVLQNLRNAALAGSVIVWEHQHLGAGRRGFTYGTRAPGLLARYVAWVLFHPAGVHRFAVLSAHWPPVRVSRWWHPFEIALRARVLALRAAGYLVIVCCDSNQHHHRRRFAGLRWHAHDAHAIDGFWVSPAIRVSHVRRLQRGTSDHHPYVARMIIPRRHP